MPFAWVTMKSQALYYSKFEVLVVRTTHLKF